jgi:membrane associated rhomboid family serine protease
VQASSPRQPIFNVPWVVLVLIGAMAAIEGLRELLPDRLDAELLARLAFVPGRFTYAVDPAGMLAHWSGLDVNDADARQRLAIARFFLGDGVPQPWTALTYALLHGGWAHVGLNSVWLLAFGTPLARRFGVVRFLVFNALGAVTGAAAHYATDPFSLQPLVGASASVSACMAATLRFQFQPARSLGEGGGAGEGTTGRMPRQPLLAVFTDRRSLAFLLVWFATNFVTGMAAVPFGLSDAPIAWQAHIGGFVIGLLAFPLFERRRPLDPDAPETAEGPAAV